MASAIQTVGGNQIVRLGSPLILGIRLQGTIGHLSSSHATHIKARPYLRYLADTLRHLRCDVTLLVSTNHQFDTHVVSQFASIQFPLPFRLLHDHDDVHQATHRNKTVSSKNYAAYFHGIAREHGCTTDRVLFIDSEINYRFTPVQTLVLETYEPMSRRQQRQEIRKRMQEDQERRVSSPFASAASSQPHSARTTDSSGRRERAASDSTHPEERAQQQKDQQRRREAHQKSVQATLDKLQNHTNILESELRFASTLTEPVSPLANEGDGGDDSITEQQHLREAASGSHSWLGRHDGRKHTITAPQQNRNAEHQHAGAAPPPPPPPHERTDNDNAAAGGRGGAFTTEEYYAAAQASGTLAINMEDYSLVALADMITQLAASDLSVRDFLATEPLIEKLRVPFHGVANYLPIENCDFIEVLDWERIKVEEKEARDGGVPDIVETDEHKDFFK